MFEIEAEDFADSKNSFWRQGKTCIESVIQAFQKGAEFGYNKANEWHYVKDGALPKEYDTVLVCTEFEQHKSCLICNYHYKKWWYADGKYDENVIAWKEIVLPGKEQKEKEQNKDWMYQQREQNELGADYLSYQGYHSTKKVLTK